MKIHKPYLFIEIQDKQFNFLVVEYNEEFEYKVLDFSTINSEGIKDGKIIDAALSTSIIQKNLNQIENKINYNFKFASIINSQSNLSCINVSSFKKLGGAQVTSEDISFIINNIKKAVTDNENNKSLIHIFNSNYMLDKEVVNNLPIGLYGNFYNQHISFFLLEKSDLKNLKMVINNCGIKIDRIIMKPFLLGIKKIKESKSSDIIILININKNTSSLSIFDKSAFIYFESFSFGSDIIMRDVSKLCSLNLSNVKKIFEDFPFDSINKDQFSGYLDKKYFDKDTFRKISIIHLIDIISPRIDEIMDLIYFKNVNLNRIIKKNKSIFFEIEEDSVYKNLKESFKSKFSYRDLVKISNKTQNDQQQIMFTAAELIGKGWEKEAIPIIQTKKSTISRIFFSLFN